MRAIAAIRARGRVPIVVGGTMLYFKALTEGLSALAAGRSRRARATSTHAPRAGWPALHAELARIDPRDRRAARRRPMRSASSARSRSAQLAGHAAIGAAGPPRAAPARSVRRSRVALLPPTARALHARSRERFDAMLAAGLVDELAALRARYPLAADVPSMRCVGYRQAWEYLDGASIAATLRARGHRGDAPARQAPVHVAARDDRRPCRFARCSDSRRVDVVERCARSRVAARAIPA